MVAMNKILQTFFKKIQKLNNSPEKTTLLNQIIENQKQLFTQCINNSKSGSVWNCQINGLEIKSPVELLQTYPHCLQFNHQGKFFYEIEIQCAEWMKSHVQQGDIVLDIGAAFGVVSLPLAAIVGEEGQVYAFEPAKRTQELLKKVVNLNHFDNITILEFAISDKPSKKEFIEYLPDSKFSWASDISTLNASSINPLHQHDTYEVIVTTIDNFVVEHKIKPKSIKIDIEGFEFYALKGAKSTLTNHRPYLCIDIHKDVETGKSAMERVEPFLLNLGYQLQKFGHTLYCTPTN